MACVENPSSRNDESEMEEGEIVDEADDLSDISSEEEFLLRQRLQVLENYNNVLERKKAKRSSIGSGKRVDSLLHDLSEISGTELEETLPQVTSEASIVVYRDQRHVKTHKQKKRKELKDSHRDVSRNKEYKKKTHRKKKLEVKVISETSEESDDEYRNKRRKLANAVVVNRDKNDTSSLQARLKKMLCGTKVTETFKTVFSENKDIESEITPNLEISNCPHIEDTAIDVTNSSREAKDQDEIEDTTKITKHVTIEAKDLCTDDEVKIVTCDEQPANIVNDPKIKVKNRDTDKDSDEDLEQLRQHALKTKISKSKVDHVVPPASENKSLTLSDDEDSDTAELRLICLKSALLKKAIEMKRKQKLQKRLSQSSNLHDELLNEQEEFLNRIESENNNTDMESVDMDIGSDLDERGKDFTHEIKNNGSNIVNLINVAEGVPNVVHKDDDELEEDEDLLRAKLLTSLSKNLPNLVDPKILNNIEDLNSPKNTEPLVKVSVPEEKRIVINVGGSDSEGEHEATKNLTKMHMKLSEQIDFQQKLDMFLKSTRMQVESKKIPDVTKKSPLPKPQKFVAKAVNHLPKSEQAEYKSLVKRMAELEKIKQARQVSMDIVNKLQIKETLKPRNVSIDSTKLIAVNSLEEQIALSRKKIAEESAKMLNLKEEATKLSQKYKIVATELRNITTAITLNKKQQRNVQMALSKIRVQHQRLLSSSTSKHSKTKGSLVSHNMTKLQKENDPSKEEHSQTHLIKSVKVSVVNDYVEETMTNVGCVQNEVLNDKKIVKTLNVDATLNANKPSSKDVKSKHMEDNLNEHCSSLPVSEIISKDSREHNKHLNERRKEFDDYESPLQALDTATWEGDPNAILCPFEVGGNCKDPDCKYLHPKIPSLQ